MKLFLIGYRGTGKTRIAEILATSWNCGWADSDSEIEHRSGKSIAQIFSQDGETAFRKLEMEVVRDLASGHHKVISLGGGSVMEIKNRTAISTQGLTCWLQATPTTIAQRLEQDSVTRSQRPNLTPVGGLEEIQTVLDKRSSVYQSCANFDIDTEGKSLNQVAEEILVAVVKDQKMNS